MPAPYTGRCSCGSVSARIDGEPLFVRQCWCRQCQKLTGGPGTTNAAFMAADIALTGELARHDYTAASGNAYTQWFCPNCGNPVMAQTSGRPGGRTIRLGFLDEGHGLRPDAAIWMREAPDWAVVDPEIDRIDAQPPIPPATT